MTKHDLLVAMIGLGMLVSTAAHAQEGAPPAAPQPSKELEAYMKPFEGTWKCDTTMPAGAMGPGSPEIKTKAKVTFKKEFGGFFWRGEYKTDKTKQMPSYSGVFYIGYDPGSKQLINVSVDSTGSAGMSAGPIEGGNGTWTGESYMMGQKMKTKETMSLKGPKEATHTFEVDTGKGYQLMGSDVCKK